MRHFAILKRNDGSEVLVPYRRHFRPRWHIERPGVHRFTAVHNARQAERTD